MNFNIGFKLWKERGVQVRQEEISVCEVGIARRWQLGKQHTIHKVQISLYRVHSLTLSDDHSIKIGVIFNVPCAFGDNTSISEAPCVRLVFCSTGQNCHGHQKQQVEIGVGFAVGLLKKISLT